MTEQIDHLQLPSAHHALQESFKQQVTRLASELAKSCEGLAALNGHSSRSPKEPFEVDALVTALRQTTHELASCAELAGNAHDQQTRFLTMIAHELRNPLSPIRTAAMLLGTGPVDQKRLEHIKTVIEFQVTHLARLIDDLMETSRPHAANFQLSLHRVDLIDVLDRAVQMCRPAMRKRDQHLTMQIPRHAVIIHGDAMRLVQVFYNLLDNASKYTSNDGRIWLSLKVHDHCARIAIEDNGIGIRPHALPFVFDLYTQGAPMPDAEHRGTGFGIGLHVVRSLIHAHKGQVAASSAGHSRGSEFIVTLPIDERNPTMTGDELRG